MEDEKFDLKLVAERFKSSLEKEDDVLMDLYLLAFREILKFFQLLGSVFSFVSSDVKTKVGILEEFRANKEVAENFNSVKQMISYEKDKELLQKKGYVSGSRTLLRLHRGLDFIRNFLRRLGEVEPDEKTSTICSLSYNETLANFHPFLIRKSANIAMYALPQRDQLLNKVCSDVQKSIEALPEMLKFTDTVYDRIDALYTVNDLHGLP